MSECFIMKLPYRLRECPVYWKNFIKSLEVDGATMTGDLEKELAKYHGALEMKFISHDDAGTRLIFPSETEFLYFKVAWL